VLRAEMLMAANAVVIATVTTNTICRSDLTIRFI